MWLKVGSKPCERRYGRKGVGCRLRKQREEAQAEQTLYCGVYIFSLF